MCLRTSVREHVCVCLLGARVSECWWGTRNGESGDGRGEREGREEGGTDGWVQVWVQVWVWGVGRVCGGGEGGWGEGRDGEGEGEGAKGGWRVVEEG